MSLHLPPHVRADWEKGDPAARFALLTTLMLAEQKEKLPDTDLLEEWEKARFFYRVKASKADFLWDLLHNISIADKGGATVLLRPFKTQWKIINYVLHCLKTGRPIRLLVPKSRRHGITAIIAAIVYLYIARNKNLKALIIAQSDPDAIAIFEEKFKFFHEHDPLAPKTRRSNTTELVFEALNSSILIRSAEGRLGLGRGSGFHVVYGTEVAYYKTKIHQKMTGIFATVPKFPHMSMIFLETTGNGPSGFFYEEDMKAKQGKSEWQRMFLPAHERHDARMALKDEAEAARIQESLTDEEKLWIKDFGVDLTFIKWMRHVEENDIPAPTAQLRRMLRKQEHPMYDHECYQSVGSSAFDLERVTALMARDESVVFEGDIAAVGKKSVLAVVGNLSDRSKLDLPLWSKADNAWVEITPTPVLLKRAGGPLRIFRRPEKGHRYSMGIDLCAAPSTESDLSEIVIIDRDRREVVAHYIAALGSNHMLEPTRLLCKLYNKAVIVPEVAFFQSFIGHLLESDVKKSVFWREVPDETSADRRMTKKHGIVMGKQVKRNGVDLLREKLDNEPGFFNRHVLQQLQTFKQVQSETTGEWLYPGALPGSGDHDDGVIALMMALFGDRDAPLRGKSPMIKTEEAPRTVRDRVKEHLEYEASLKLDREETW